MTEWKRRDFLLLVTFDLTRLPESLPPPSLPVDGCSTCKLSINCPHPWDVVGFSLRTWGDRAQPTCVPYQMFIDGVLFAQLGQPGLAGDSVWGSLINTLAVSVRILCICTDHYYYYWSGRCLAGQCISVYLPTFGTFINTVIYDPELSWYLNSNGVFLL